MMMRHIYTALTVAGIVVAFVAGCLFFMWTVYRIEEAIRFKTERCPKWKRAHRKMKKVGEALPVVFFFVVVLLVLIMMYMEIYKTLWH